MCVAFFSIPNCSLVISGLNRSALLSKLRKWVLHGAWSCCFGSLCCCWLPAGPWPVHSHSQQSYATPALQWRSLASSSIAVESFSPLAGVFRRRFKTGDSGDSGWPLVLPPVDDWLTTYHLFMIHLTTFITIYLCSFCSTLELAGEASFAVASLYEICEMLNVIVPNWLTDV